MSMLLSCGQNGAMGRLEGLPTTASHTLWRVPEAEVGSGRRRDLALIVVLFCA
jgi:hypothetical protein